MPTEKFIDKKFSASSEAVILEANQIIDEYRDQGFTLTLRQLYYQFVARALIPNTQRDYKRLGSILNDARLAGRVDRDAIEDRTRNLQAQPHWDSPAEIVESCARQFRFDKWADQPSRPEVWIEKEALVGVIEPICLEFDIPYFACRGYSSQSEQWRAGKRFAKYQDLGQSPVVFHLGDHDPSGVDMTWDNWKRLNLFSGYDWDVVKRHYDKADALRRHNFEHLDVEVRRLALNMDQVEQYNPPPNPAKMSDSRSTGYVGEFGDQSWELDALDPPTIDALIREAVESILDVELWGQAVERERQARRTLQAVSDNWDDVVDQYEGEP